MLPKDIDVDEIYQRDKNLRKEDVSALLEWADLQPHLPKITELEMALFLHSCRYSNEFTKVTVDVYYTVHTLCPDILGNRRPSDPAVLLAIDTMLICPLPKLTPGGDTVIFVKLMNNNPDNYNMAQTCKCFDMILSLHLHKNGPSNGVIILFDTQDLVFGHFLKLSVVVMKKFLYYMQEGMPIRLKSIQYFNVVSFMDKILNLMKPFMKKELYDAMIPHNDMESVYKHVPQDILPQDYGGSCESVAKLHEKYKADMCENEEFFTIQETQLVDESKRAGKPKNISDVFGMEGTFKKLEVD